MISFKDLAKGLGIDKSNLSRLLKRLDIVGTKVRGNQNQWSKSFSDSEVEKVLEYRKGIPHHIVKTDRGYEYVPN